MKIIKIIQKILHIKLTIATIIILPIAIFALLTSKMEIAGMRSFVVLTGSMQPTIPQGSVTFVQKAKNFQKGDIISFNQGTITITHRVVDVIDQKYQTKGDANNTADATLIAQKDVIGRTFFHLPYVGSFILNLKTLPGFIGFIIIPGILFMGFELWKIKEEIEKEVQKKFTKQLV